jgi:hypothetical protein
VQRILRDVITAMRIFVSAARKTLVSSDENVVAPEIRKSWVPQYTI